jgi:hypothetical protein
MDAENIMPIGKEGRKRAVSGALKCRGAGFAMRTRNDGSTKLEIPLCACNVYSYR